MRAEPQFLSFPGLQPQAPQPSWNESKTMAPATPPTLLKSVPDNVPTLTEPLALGPGDAKPHVFDPLIHELFDQLRVSPTDELTQTWRTIAAEVNLLSQRMALQRELQDRLKHLDQDLAELRTNITTHLQEVQQAADQQLSSARLRAEVSALAQSKLAAKLQDKLY
ncbi:hypothetical protein [Limnohabitans sp. B9-3]|uniref:hypothetical protein n=1 Tax=Limnohabitans sp. B9-3 TaxID=1100707 RepID=UPI000C1E090A|nr:hypothetical protein [Limnohabitans sp. B9-3]PIT76152.1 hypothetical protein B9Z42_05405 [Limnohabitans sp. B9-3]